MQRTKLTMIALACFSLNLSAQQLSVNDRQILETARAKYYNLQAHGFESATCSVSFDYATVPFLPSANADEDRKLFQATVFTLRFDGKQTVVQHVYPPGTSEPARQRLQQETSLLESLISGVFLTWPTKGFQGPIPPFDSQVDSLAETKAGYILTLKVSGGPVKVSLDKNYRVIEIESAGGKIIERPEFVDSPEGLVFESNQVNDNTGGGGEVQISYDLKTNAISEVRLPTVVHLKVQQSIDVKFTLTNCVVEKAMVIQLKK